MYAALANLRSLALSNKICLQHGYSPFLKMSIEISKDFCLQAKSAILNLKSAFDATSSNLGYIWRYNSAAKTVDRDAIHPFELGGRGRRSDYLPGSSAYCSTKRGSSSISGKAWYYEVIYQTRYSDHSFPDARRLTTLETIQNT
jgi:hypothetical protein